MKLPRLAMKAAPSIPEQIQDRLTRLKALSLPAALELHTFGAADVEHTPRRAGIVAAMADLRARYDLDAVLHVPPLIPRVAEQQLFDLATVLSSVELAKDVGCEGVVCHRYFAPCIGRTPSVPYDEAWSAFCDAIQTIAKAAGTLTVYVENLGTYLLSSISPRAAFTSSIDHFFPWEVTRFLEDMRGLGLNNVRVLVDIAHATLSANAFNARRLYGSRLMSAPFVATIRDSDLDQTEWLSPLAFISNSVSGYHFSDSFFASPEDLKGADFDAPEVFRKLFASEGLPFGVGNLEWSEVVSSMSEYLTEKAWVVAEINPGPEDTYECHASQQEALSILLAAMKRN